MYPGGVCIGVVEHFLLNWCKCTVKQLKCLPSLLRYDDIILQYNSCHLRCQRTQGKTGLIAECLSLFCFPVFLFEKRAWGCGLYIEDSSGCTICEPLRLMDQENLLVWRLNKFNPLTGYDLRI